MNVHMVSSIIPPTSPLTKTVFVLVYGKITRLDCRSKQLNTYFSVLLFILLNISSETVHTVQYNKCQWCELAIMIE